MNVRLIVAHVIALLAATPAWAQTAAGTAVPRPFSVDATVTLTSDYRFRGISQSNLQPSIQGTANVTHTSGLYVGTFVATIGKYVVDGANPEIDLYGGLRKTFGSTTIDGGLLYYVYPGTNGFKGNSYEPYLTLSHTIGPVTGRAGVNIAWKQQGLQLQPDEKRSAFYAFTEVAAAIPSTPVTVTGHLGHAFRATYGTFGVRYTDWSLTAGYTRGRMTVSAAYVDTDKAIQSYPGGRTDHDVGGAGLLGSVAVAF